MGSIAPERTHPSIYLLNDHLDAALAMGEDLLREMVVLDNPPGASPLRDWMRQNRDLSHFLTSVRTLEYAMTARLLQARKRAQELKRRETRLKPLIGLFIGGTAPLVDAAEELGDTDARDFDGLDTGLSFLRQRGLLAPDVAGLDGLTRLAVSEDYLVAGRIHLGTLMNLVATFLDTLDRLFDLYAERAETDEAAVSLPEVAGALPAEPAPSR